MALFTLTGIFEYGYSFLEVVLRMMIEGSRSLFILFFGALDQ
jgi:hypothetical protein